LTQHLDRCNAFLFLHNQELYYIVKVNKNIILKLNDVCYVQVPAYCVTVYPIFKLCDSGHLVIGSAHLTDSINHE